MDKRGLHVITISFNGPAYDAAQRDTFLNNAQDRDEFPEDFDAKLLVVFSPNRTNLTEASFKVMCESFNRVGELADEMGFRAGLHNHMGQMVQTQEEVDRCMAMTDPKLFWFSPDLAHLYLAGCDPASNLDKHRSRLMMMDYKDAKKEASQIPRSDFRSGRWRYRLPGLPQSAEIHEL